MDERAGDRSSSESGLEAREEPRSADRSTLAEYAELFAAVLGKSPSRADMERAFEELDPSSGGGADAF